MTIKNALSWSIYFVCSVTILTNANQLSDKKSELNPHNPLFVGFLFELTYLAFLTGSPSSYDLSKDFVLAWEKKLMKRQAKKARKKQTNQKYQLTILHR